MRRYVVLCTAHTYGSLTRMVHVHAHAGNGCYTVYSFIAQFTVLSRLPTLITHTVLCTISVPSRGVSDLKVKVDQDRSTSNDITLNVEWRVSVLAKLLILHAFFTCLA